MRIFGSRSPLLELSVTEKAYKILTHHDSTNAQITSADRDSGIEYQGLKII
jgi:hypothetical protein